MSLFEYLCYYTQDSFVFSLPHALQAPTSFVCKRPDCLRVTKAQTSHTGWEGAMVCSKLSGEAQRLWDQSKHLTTLKVLKTKRKDKIRLCEKNIFSRIYRKRHLSREIFSKSTKVVECHIVNWVKSLSGNPLKFSILVFHMYWSLISIFGWFSSLFLLYLENNFDIQACPETHPRHASSYGC